MDDKVIVTNRRALMKKYGRQETAKICQTLRAFHGTLGGLLEVKQIGRLLGRL